MNLSTLETLDPLALPSVALTRHSNLPACPGIYFALDTNGTVLYIGMAESLQKRWDTRHHRKKQLLEMGDVRLSWLIVEDVALLRDIEAALIQHFNPPLNGTMKPPSKARSPWRSGAAGQYSISSSETADSVSLLNYHFVWIPRRRRPVLIGPVAERLKVLIQETAETLDCTVVALEVMPDHVHLFLNCPPTWAPDQLMFRVKGSSARALRKEFPQLLTLPSMWTRSYFVSSAGNVSSDTIKRYIAEQTSR